MSAVERGTPAGRGPIRGKLPAGRPAGDLAPAGEKLGWYAMRRKIGTFHKALKSGSRAEEPKLRAAPRPTNRRAALCAAGRRVLRPTMAARVAPAAPL